MSRILLTLASLSIILLVAAMILGLSIGDLYQRPYPTLETSRLKSIHFLTGVAAALMVVFVESIIVTYFIGTSRWCKEVVETYRFDPEAVRNSNRLKRRTFPWALAGMLAVVAVIALGGAADPSTGRPNTAAWVNWHLVGSMGGVALIAWTYVVAWNNVVAQHAIIQQLVAQVSKVREKQGLDREAGAE
jgi:uncharacterized membrane protein